jgi:3-hydroxymyristoyl/3-hydroxydecanoyl-(acyl carrier protein) dehydratase
MNDDRKTSDPRHLDLDGTTDDGRTSDVVIPADYVFFRGHFPDAPMLPGVVQLTEILVPLIRRRFPELGAVKQLRRVRFRRPVLPGETLHIELGELEHTPPSKTDGARAEVRFDLSVGSAVVANGSISFDAVRGTS